MKILILTQPLGCNYGGILQAYAMQKVLTDLGHEVETLDRRKSFLAYKLIPNKILAILLKFFNKENFCNLRKFINKHLKMSPCITSTQSLIKYFSNKNVNAVIVGSDQVWRPQYSPNLSNFFCDFLENFPYNVKRISYAASFGVDEWEYTPEQTKLCKPLIQKFNALSVREESAVSLCQKYFDVTPKIVLDPTMLLSLQDYKNIFKSIKKTNLNNQSLVFFLDKNADKENIALKISTILGQEINYIMPDSKTTPYMGVDSWLYKFYYSDYIITDSFHGCVFSIIFNKPFIAIGNKERGIARFTSLLSLFKLEDRLIFDASDVNEKLINSFIDWEIVNQIKQDHIKEAKNFLIDILNAPDL